MPALAVLLALGGASAARPDDTPWLRIGGAVENDTALRVHEPRVLQKIQSQLALDVEAALLPSLRLRALGRTIWDPRARLVGDHPDFDQEPIDRAQLGGSRRWEAELREIYLDWSTRVGPARLDLRAGKQQVVWGQAFGVRILDVVNAQDFREFILDDFIESRIPVFGVRADAFVSGWRLQAFAFPDFEQDRFAALGSEYQLSPDLPGLLPSLATFEIPRFIPTFAPVDLQDEETPQDWRLSSTTVGLRVARFWKGFDLSLHYLDGLDPRPTFRRFVEVLTDPDIIGLEVPLNHLQPDHFRIHVIGGSFSTTWRSFTFWGEGITALGRAFVIDDLGDPVRGVRLPTDIGSDGVVRKTEIQYLLAADWTGWSRLFANVQLLHGVIVSDDERIQIPRNRFFASLLLRFNFRNETLFPQLYVLYGIRDHESMIRPSLEWKASDRWSIVLGADLFSGPKRGILGQYANPLPCREVPENVPGADVGGPCQPPVGPGNPGRVFIRLRYAFSFTFARETPARSSSADPR